MRASPALTAGCLSASLVLCAHRATADDRFHGVVLDDGSIAPAAIDEVLRPALRVYRDRDGLPQNSAMALAFATDGALWVGTQDGVASFDGTTWATSPLPAREISSFVRSLLVDRAGALWVGRPDGGLARLRDGTWSRFDVDQGLPASAISALAETADGTVWAGTRGGLARFDGSAWHRFEDGAALPSARVTRLLAGTDDDGRAVLWVGTDAGLARVRDGRATLVEGAPRASVRGLLQTSEPDGATSLWVAGAHVPLARRHGGSWTSVPPKALPDGEVTALAESTNSDGASVLWVGTEGGIVRHEHGRWVPLPDDALPSRTTWSFAKQPATGPTSDLWIGLDTGLARLHLGGFRSVDRAIGLPADSVYAVLVTQGDDGESLWVGTRGGGLARYAAGRWHTFGPAEGFDAHTVFALAEHAEPDGGRRVYVGTQDAGLLRWDGARFSVVEGEGGVRQLVSAPGEGGRPELWATFSERGVLHHAGDAWTWIDRKHGAPWDAAYATVDEHREDGGRVLWVATQGAGLARREGERWTMFDRKVGALRSDSVLSVSLLPRPDGRAVLWAGTESGGVAFADRDDPEPVFRTLTTSTEPALPNDTVYQVRGDASGRVYLFTNRGVARLAWSRDAPGGLALETLTTDDGLPADEFNGGASSVDARGRIWAGTIAGATMLDPARSPPEPEPALRLSGRVTSGGGRVLAPGAVLAHDDRGVTFDARLVALFRGDDARYRFELEGFDAHPTEFRAEGHRELESLPAGRYVFRVWAEDHRGRVHGPVALPFEVRQAPWLTAWALALYAAAAGALVWATVRLRVRAIERQNRALEARIAERTRELGEKVGELAVSERRAREAEDDALRANRAKTTFLSTMSHELRTPLNAILGFAQLLTRDRALSPESRENVDVVVQSGEHLLGLINDVLSITRIESGKLALDESTFALAGTVEAVEKMIRVRARSKRLSLQVELRPGTPPFVRGDEGKLRQILLNLLSNAVKFTAEGGVALRVSWEAGRARFEVQDTGAGIAPDDQARLFEPFVQTATGKRAREGTGLGLFITRSYARLLGGDVAVESVLGRGTTFVVDVALPRADAAPARSDARRVTGLAPGQGPIRMLVVDDSPDNRAVLVKLFGALGGFELREAAGGAEAVRIFAEQCPRVTWMDLRMDGVDGIAATQAMRELEAREGRPRSTILALSASAFDRDREWLLASGCDDFLSKPFREATLFEALERHAGLRFQHEGEAAGAPPAAPVTAERCAGLPHELRDRLREAARSGDLRVARTCTVEVERHDVALGRDLRAMVDTFRLEEIEAILGEHG